MFLLISFHLIFLPKASPPKMQIFGTAFPCILGSVHLFEYVFKLRGLVHVLLVETLDIFVNLYTFIQNREINEYSKKYVSIRLHLLLSYFLINHLMIYHRGEAFVRQGGLTWVRCGQEQGGENLWWS